MYGHPPCAKSRRLSSVVRPHDSGDKSSAVGAEILEIVAVVVDMNVRTRIKLAEGAMPGSA
jgi:hypothetical protein